MKNRLATWLMVGMLPLFSSCAYSSRHAALSPVDPQAAATDESTSSGYAKADTAWDDVMAKNEADIVRLPDGRIVGLLPPECSP